MNAAVATAIAFAGYVAGYLIYSRYLSERVFELREDLATPARSWSACAPRARASARSPRGLSARAPRLCCTSSSSSWWRWRWASSSTSFHCSLRPILPATWPRSGSLGAKIGNFINGCATFLHALGVPKTIGASFTSVFVVSYALTSLAIDI